LWLVSFAIIVASLHAAEEESPLFLSFEPATIAMEAEVQAEYRVAWGFRHVETEGVEKIEALFTFPAEHFDHFPIPFVFTLKKFGWEGLKEKGTAPRPLSVREGRCLENLPMKGEVNTLPPFLEFSPEVRKKFRFSLLANPPFGEELFTLIEIGKRPLAEGVEFTIAPSGSNEPVAFSKEVKVLSVKDNQVLLEVKTIYKRMKLNLPDGDKAVVSGSSQGKWTVHPGHSFVFSIEEEGMMTGSIQLGQSVASRIYQYKKRVDSRVLGD
jgi:hypothetical protein